MEQRVYKSIKIDKDKFNKTFSIRHLNMNEVSIAMGFSSTFLRNCGVKGKLSESAALLLDKIYNITRDEYEVREEVIKAPVADKSEVPVEVVKYEPIDYEKLSRVITVAVYEAVSKAWNEPLKKEGE